MKYSSEKIEKLLAIINNKRKNAVLNAMLLYGSALFLGIAIIIATLLFNPFMNQATLYLLFFPAVTLSAWYGNFRTTSVTTVTAILGISYLSFIGNFFMQPAVFVPIFLLLLEGLFIGIVIEKAKKNDKVTEYKQREKEYMELLMQMQEKYVKGQEEIRARDEFLSIASHELKTPLTSMILQLQTVLHNIRNVSLANFSVENLLKMLDNAEQQSKRVSKMINDLLNVSLITTGRLDLEREETDLVEVVKEVIDSFSEKTKREGYTIKFHADKQVIGIWDKMRISQVVTNLLSNAIKYGEKKPIEISVTHHGNIGKLIVKDHGIGIPAEEQDKVFARFERAIAAKSKVYQGLGVGLYITQQIVVAHEGSIHVESEPGYETTFTVELPLKKIPRK